MQGVSGGCWISGSQLTWQRQLGRARDFDEPRLGESRQAKGWSKGERPWVLSGRIFDASWDACDFGEIDGEFGV